MAQVKIRQLTMKDYEAMLKLWKQAGLPCRPKGRDSRRMTAVQMKKFPEFYLGAFDNDKLVGIIIGSYETRFKGWINRLAVDPEHQRQGTAQQLVKKMEDTLRKHGAEILCALIETPNKESENLFQKMGYKVHKDILYLSKRENEKI